MSEIARIVSHNDPPRVINGLRQIQDANWALVLVTDTGRIKHVSFHPQGNTSPWIICDIEERADGTYVVSSPELAPKAVRMGWRLLEDMYAEEGRRDALGENGAKQPSKTWLAYREYHRLLRIGAIPWVRDSSGSRVRKGFPAKNLPDAVLQLQELNGMISEQQLDVMLDGLGRGAGFESASSGSSGEAERTALLEDLGEPMPQATQVVASSKRRRDSA